MKLQLEWQLSPRIAESGGYSTSRSTIGFESFERQTVLHLSTFLITKADPGGEVAITGVKSFFHQLQSKSDPQLQHI